MNNSDPLWNEFNFMNSAMIIHDVIEIEFMYNFIKNEFIHEFINEFINEFIHMNSDI